MNVVLVGAALLLAACAPAADAPQVRKAHFKAPLPGKALTVGYFELHNPTAQPWTLEAVRAAVGTSVEIHETVQEEDRVRMQRVAAVPLPPGDTVRFAPGGLHLMLFGVEALPDSVAVTLHFEGQRSVAATFAVERW